MSKKVWRKPELSELGVKDTEAVTFMSLTSTTNSSGSKWCPHGWNINSSACPECSGNPGNHNGNGGHHPKH